MNLCINIIRNEASRDGWLYELTDEDIRRILARYKEHVTYWNIKIEPITAELQVFADAVGRSFYSVARMFDSLEPKRFSPVIVFNLARIRKEVFVPWTNNPNMGNWTVTNFVQQEVANLQSRISRLDPNATVTLLTPPSLCQIQGSFTREDLEVYLHEAQQFSMYMGTSPIQYNIIALF